LRQWDNKPAAFYTFEQVRKRGGGAAVAAPPPPPPRPSAREKKVFCRAHPRCRDGAACRYIHACPRPRGDGERCDDALCDDDHLTAAELNSAEERARAYTRALRGTERQRTPRPC
jgi:hypothetical protein